ncbi:flavin-containing monooxygenase [Streptantibioticus ferralitis]|uniref:NAD(P)/FAD-dependent oxidoreductase n=1 Tax=Streptantibioticus ferralitis TaxID=236510 RepID=A0ABT5Z8F9_9ACTN|nr:NAD(P)/FAD-dependent oxidoreductase [Streptantibioticus ferralitis]MDF2260108.1 NAD(P)/FAD-dependent oxidoreductase [Streptantibioticus ferralitis]
MVEHVDVLIVGAGLSGIGAACHLRRGCPERTVAILEARDAVGGTWDLFRYPGVRSDSDMHTLGYRIRPWTEPKSIADGPSILAYIQQTAQEYGLLETIRLRHRVVSADWDGEQARWTVHAERGEDTGAAEAATMTCSFLYVCAGYYRYDAGYRPRFPDAERFEGVIVHPQHWPEDLDFTGRRVVVIGSGATAVTLVPAMAEQAAHVTMLQRSPTYVMSLPTRDTIAGALRRVLPKRTALAAVRWKNALLALGFYRLSRKRPDLAKSLLRKGVAKQLPAGYDVETHFVPRYDPWDQRLCVVPDGDLFRAISAGRASVVTDHIDAFTPTGIQLRSGEELPADVVVTATGLNMLAFGGIRLTVAGRPVDPGSTVAYKTMMLCDVPNFAWTLGYTNSSWTLKADLVAQYVCRLLNYMAARGHAVVQPLSPPAEEPVLPIIDLQSGYVLRGADAMPKRGLRAPWRTEQSYLRDVRLFRRGPVDDGVLFTPAPLASVAGPRRPDNSSAETMPERSP